MTCGSPPRAGCRVRGALSEEGTALTTLWHDLMARCWVLTCEECGPLGTWNKYHNAVWAKKKHDRMHAAEQG